MMAARAVRDQCKPLAGATLKNVCRYVMEDWAGDKTPQEIIDQVSKLKGSGITDRSSRELFEPFEVVRYVEDIEYHLLHGHYPEDAPKQGCELCFPTV
jgi:hypothetical protein